MERKISKESVLAILFLVLTFSTFFMKGMYFEGEQFLYLSLLGILGIVTFFLIPGKECFGRSLDWFVLSIVIIYIISSFHAFYLRNAIVEVLKYSGVFLAFVLSKRLLKDRIDWFVVTIYLAGVFMSFVGLGAASGLYHIDGAYLEKENIVASLFQYHNTSAIVLACVFVFGLSLYSKASKMWYKLLVSAGNMIALLTIIFSSSRGTWLLFPIILILYYFLLPKGDRGSSVPVLGTIVSAFLIMRGCGNALAEQNTAVFFLYMICSICLAVGFSYLLEKNLDKLIITKKNAIFIGIVLILLILILVLFGKYLLPQSMIQRITSFTMESRTVLERMTFYKDAFTVFKLYPVLGVGGGGWPYVYSEYKSYRYLSNSPHSFLLHLIVETGMLGILVFLFLVITMFRLLIKLLKAEKNVKKIYAPLFVSAAGIFVHSMFDFDFTYYTVTVTVWMILGLISEIEIKNQAPKNGWLRWVGILCSLLILICGFVGKIAWDNYYKTAQYMVSDNKKAYEYASKATALDAGNSMYAITKGNMGFHLAAIQTDEQQLRFYAQQAEDALEQGYRYNPRDHMLIKELSTFYVNTGKFDQGCAMAENLIKLAPLNYESYEHVAVIYTTVAQEYQKKNDIAGIKKAMGRLTTLMDELAAYHEQRGLHYNTSKVIIDAVEQAQSIMKQIEGLEEKE